MKHKKIKINYFNITIFLCLQLYKFRKFKALDFTINISCLSKNDAINETLSDASDMD